MQPRTFLFLAHQIGDAIYGKYFNVKRQLRMLDPEFINCVNGTMVCLTCAILFHQPFAYPLGVYQDPPDFKPDAVGGRRPSMSPPSLVFVLMTNQSCKTFSYGRRTPGGQYHGQGSNSCSGICIRSISKKNQFPLFAFPRTLHLLAAFCGTIFLKLCNQKTRFILRLI